MSVDQLIRKLKYTQGPEEVLVLSEDGTVFKIAKVEHSEEVCLHIIPYQEAK